MKSLRRQLRALLPDPLRQLALRLRLRLSGVRVAFGPRARIDTFTTFEDNAAIGCEAAVFGCRVGRCTYLGDRVFAVYSDIGAFCSVAPNVVIGGGQHPTTFVSTSPRFYSTIHNPWGPFAGAISRDDALPKTVVGNDVWIGYGAILLPGITVGTGSVIAAGSVVTRDVEPYSIVMGVPARTVRMRFKPEDAAWLLALAWWQWPEERLKALRPQFRSVASLRAALGTPSSTEMSAAQR